MGTLSHSSIMKTPITLALAFISSASVSFGAMTYVDMTSSNTVRSGGGTWTATNSPANDNLYNPRAFGNGSTIFESNQNSGTTGENAPGLVTTISGLTVGASYVVEGYFWSNAFTAAENWRFRGSLTTVPPLGDNINHTFSRHGSADSQNAPALATGVDSTDNLGVTYSGSGTLAANNAFWNSTSYFTTAVMIGQGNRALYSAALGTAVADENGEINVYIDDYDTVYHTSGYNRAWLDGVGFELVPEPSGFLMSAVAMSFALLRRRRP